MKIQFQLLVLIIREIGLGLVNGETRIIIPFSFPSPIMVGNRVGVLCGTLGGEIKSIKWLKNGETLNERTKVTINSYEDSSTLKIDHLNIGDSGNYTCLVTTKEGVERYTATLKVLAPAEWVSFSNDKVAYVGTNATLECLAKGVPMPSVTWQFNPKDPRASYDARKWSQDHRGSTLIHLINIKEENDGEYICVANNSIGMPLTKTIRLSVLMPARFEEKFSIETVRRGDSATIKCKAKGDDPLTIIWIKDKQDIMGDARYERFESSEKDGLNSELFIRNVERQDGALYNCQAKNNYGSDERNIKVVVVEVPAQILDARVQEVWSRSVSISWSAPYSGNSVITKYIIQYWRDKVAPHKLHEHDVSASQTTATISKSLQPGVSYALTIIAENEVGQGEPSKEVQFVTGEEEPSGPPTDVWAIAKGSSSIEVQWKAPPKDDWNGEIKGFYVGYKVDRTSQTYSYKTVYGSGNETTNHMLTDLNKATRYNIVVKAYNGAGTGPPSQDLLVKTLEGELPPPPAVAVLAASSDSISVKWGHTDALSEKVTVKVTGYTIHLQKDSGEWMHIPMIISEQNRYTLTGLESGTNYKVYVTANNQFGRGHPSETLSIKTAITGMQLRLPFNVDMGVIIPAATGTIAVIVVIIVVIIYIKKIKSRRKFEKSLEASKNPTYAAGTNQRYIDIDKARPMLPPGVLACQEPGTITPGSTYAAYACIPSRDGTIDSRVYGTGRHEMKTFQEELKPGQDGYNDYYSGRNERPPTYPRANSKKSNPYDPKQ